MPLLSGIISIMESNTLQRHMRSTGQMEIESKGNQNSKTDQESIVRGEKGTREQKYSEYCVRGITNAKSEE